jgi:ABC-type transport system involved in Fe-S cluster assembly fused permease/ATPase subunit
MSFSGKYNSKVGEGVVKLSGGEKQRLAIARVLLKLPQIVLLDEATSAVDTLTEEQIQQAFQRLRVGRTVLMIAHRLSTVMDADLILVLQGGRIVQRGTHRQLLQCDGKYHKLWMK